MENKGMLMLDPRCEGYHGAINPKLEAVSEAYSEYRKRLKALTLGELRDFLDNSILFDVEDNDIRLRMLELCATQKKIDWDKFVKVDVYRLNALGSLYMDNMKTFDEAYAVAREESEQALKVEFESHEWYLPIKHWIEFDDFDAMYFEMYGQKVDMDKCPCISREAVEAAVETVRTKDPTWDYGTVLRAIVRPATDEEIAQRGVWERGDA